MTTRLPRVNADLDVEIFLRLDTRHTVFLSFLLHLNVVLAVGRFVGAVQFGSFSTTFFTESSSWSRKSSCSSSSLTASVHGASLRRASNPQRRPPGYCNVGLFSDPFVYVPPSTVSVSFCSMYRLVSANMSPMVKSRQM